MEKSYLRFEEYRCALVADKIQSLADLSSYRLPFAAEKQIDELFTDSGDVKEAAESDSENFRFRIYHDLAGEKYLIAFAGTDPVQPVHWLNNIRQWAGLNAEMYERGVALLGHLKPHQKERVLLTGHSLGGGIATMAAAVHRIRAVVFNPPGIHAHTLQQYDVNPRAADSLVRRFVVQGDILDLINRIPLTQITPIGRTRKIYGSTEIPLQQLMASFTAAFQTTVDLHKMSEVYVGMQKWCDEIG